MKTTMRVFLFLMVWVSAAAVAAPSVAPGELVESTANKMLETIKAERENLEKDPQRIYRLVDEIVLPHFDFPRMAKRVLGKHWRKATPDQRKAFTEVFRQLLVRTYANSLTEYTDQKIVYFPVRQKPGAKKVMVRSEVELASGTPIEVAYLLSVKGDRWMIYDIKVDGVSLVTNFRSSFSREINQSGIDSLIDKLAAKTAGAVS